MNAEKPDSVADTWDEVLEFVLAEIDNVPDGWGNYSGHWRSGYNQCRNKVARLLEIKRRIKPNDEVRHSAGKTERDQK